MHFTSLRIGRNDRATLVGQTGCGKTTLAEFLIEDRNKRCSVAFDPKGSESVAKWNGSHKRYSSLMDLIEGAEEREEERLIFTPDALIAESPELHEALFAWVYDRGYTRLYIDEATSLQGGTNPSRYLTACLNRGRERGISTIVSTQRPARIPSNIISEAQHFYIFKLLLRADRQRIEELTGIQIEEQTTLKHYEFFYWNASNGAYPKKLKLNLGRSNGKR